MTSPESSLNQMLNFRINLMNRNLAAMRREMVHFERRQLEILELIKKEAGR